MDDKIAEKWKWQEELKNRVKVREDRFLREVQRFKDEDPRSEMWLNCTKLCDIHDNPIVEVGTLKK